MKGSIGVSMNGRIIDVNKIRSSKSKCKKCVHKRWNKYGQPYCDYYQKIYPAKTKCIRFLNKKDDKYLHKTKKPERAGTPGGGQDCFPWERNYGGE